MFRFQTDNAWIYTLLARPHVSCWICGISGFPEFGARSLGQKCAYFFAANLIRYERVTGKVKKIFLTKGKRKVSL